VGRTLARGALTGGAVAAAFVGGLLATVLYDGWVAPPRSSITDRAEARAATSLGAEMLRARPRLGADSSIDPLQQAVASVWPALSLDAVVAVNLRAEQGVVFVSGEVDSRRTLQLVGEALGDLPGVRAVDTREARLVSRAHVIEAGDNLSRLARRYYGESCRWRRIAEHNPPHLSERLPIGATILVPPRDD